MALRRTRLIVAFLLLPAPAFSATLLVPSQYPTIQVGIDAAQVADTVLVAPGTYAGSGNRDLDLHGKDLVLVSESGAEATIIDCEYAGRAVNFRSGESRAAILDGFTITRGNGAPEGAPGMRAGGAVICEGSSPTIRRCVFVANRVYADEGRAEGGAMYCLAGSPLIEDCGFSQNYASGRGAGIAAYQSDLTILRCDFSRNTATYDEHPFGGGGGMYLIDCSGAIEETAFWRNGAGSAGGGVYCEGIQAPDFRRCQFTENNAGGGGGMVMRGGGYPVVEACIFVQNFAAHSHVGGWGGAVSCSGSPEFRRCLFHRNRAWGDRGGAVISGGVSVPPPTFKGCTFTENQAAEGSTFESSRARIENCIIAFGFPGEAMTARTEGSIEIACSDIYGNAGGDWTEDISEQFGVEGNFSADPLFCGREVGDLTLDANSPCLPGQHPDGADCGLIGAFPYGCGEPTHVEARSWGWVKRLHSHSQH